MKKFALLGRGGGGGVASWGQDSTRITCLAVIQVVLRSRKFCCCGGGGGGGGKKRGRP